MEVQLWSATSIPLWTTPVFMKLVRIDVSVANYYLFIVLREGI